MRGASNFRTRYRDPELVERARRIRAERRGPTWTRLFGCMLVVLAGSFALDPDYPLPRHLLASSSAGSDDELRWERPRLVHPMGVSATTDPRFEWRFDGPPFPFTLVLLDQDHEELARLPQSGTGSCRVTGALAARLLGGAQVHWYVEGNTGSRWLRSAPAAAVFSR